MDLRFSRTCFSVVMNLAHSMPGGSPFSGYAGKSQASQIHDVFGGRLLFESEEQGVGGGFVPDSPALRATNVYRLNGANCRFADFFNRSYTVGDRQVYVAIDAAARVVRNDWPVIIARAPFITHPEGAVRMGTSLTLLKPTSVLAYLKDEAIRLQEMAYNFCFIPQPGAASCTFLVTVRAEPGAVDRRKLRSIVEGFFYGAVRFNWAGQEPTSSQPFFNRLRLWRGRDGMFYRITGGICRAALRELPADLQAIAPANVKVLSPRLYVNEEGAGRFVVVGLVYTGEPVPAHVVLPISVTEAIRAMGGDFNHLYERCEQAALGLQQPDLPAAASDRVVAIA